MRVGRPRVGELDPGREVTERRRGGSPQAERAVDVQPGALVAAERRDLVERVERARVHLAGLRADDGRARDPAKRVRQPVEAHTALGVDVDPDCRRGPEPQQAQRAVDRHVALSARHHGDRRGACEPALLDVPARPLENGMTRCGEARHVRELAARDERERRRPGDAEQVLEPLARNLLDHGGRRTADDEACVLVPRRREPVGRERGRQRSSDHEPEVAPARNGDDASLRGIREGFDDLCWITRAVGQRPPESGAQLIRRRGGPDRPFVERVEEVRRDLCRPPQQVALVVHASGV